MAEIVPYFDKFNTTTLAKGWWDPESIPLGTSPECVTGPVSWKRSEKLHYDPRSKEAFFFLLHFFIFLFFFSTLFSRTCRDTVVITTRIAVSETSVGTTVFSVCRSCVFIVNYVYAHNIYSCNNKQCRPVNIRSSWLLPTGPTKRRLLCKSY